MNKTAAAEALAWHVIREANARGVTQITDRFALDVIAEAGHPAMEGRGVYEAAQVGPAFSRVKAHARRLLLRWVGTEP